jgi:hypothetical protein
VPRLCMNRAPDRGTGEGAMTKVLIKYCQQCPTVPAIGIGIPLRHAGMRCRPGHKNLYLVIPRHSAATRWG